jgi:hypothetical protein
MNRALPMPLASRHWARARTADAEQLDQLERVLLVRRRVRVDQVRLHQRVLRAWTRAGMAFPMIAARYSDDQYPLFRMPIPHYQLPLMHITPTPHPDYQLLGMPHSQCPPLAHPLRSLRNATYRASAATGAVSSAVGRSGGEQRRYCRVRSGGSCSSCSRTSHRSDACAAECAKTQHPIAEPDGTALAAEQIRQRKRAAVHASGAHSCCASALLGAAAADRSSCSERSAL